TFQLLALFRSELDHGNLLPAILPKNGIHHQYVGSFVATIDPMKTPRNASRAPLMRLEGVGRTYQMGEVAVEVLKRVSFEIRTGEFLAIVGPSGSGKTTILNLIGGLDRPTVGHVWYQDRELTMASGA